MNTVLTRFLGYIGLTDLERRHQQWRYEQISLEIEAAETECAQLAAHIGRLQAEKAELERELNYGD
jgi:cell division protein FtsB